MKVIKDIISKYRKFYRVDSHTEPGVYYTIEVEKTPEGNKYYCDCPSHVAECKHVKQIKKKLGDL